MKLNLGSGQKNLDGYVNIDAVKHTKETIVGDVLNLSYKDATVDVIFSSHVIEHLDKVELNRFFSEARRMLRIGGHLEIIAPCLSVVLSEYFADRVDINYLDNFLFGLHKHRYDFHKQGIYKEKFELLCNKYGFKITEISYGDSPGSKYEIFLKAIAI